MNFLIKWFSPLDYDTINKLKTFYQVDKFEEYLTFSKEIAKRIKIVDNHEPLLPLKQYLDKAIQIKLCNLNVPNVNDNDRLFLRRSVINKLNQAQKLLPKGYHLMIRDAFRSEKLVWDLYNYYCYNLKQLKPNMADQVIDLEVRNKIATPDDILPPGHMTGGAVDVVLGDDHGEFISTRIAGTNFINQPEHQYTFCQSIPKDMYKNRMILYRAMKKVGFNNFFREYWHYSYGDGHWAMLRKKKVAFYGIVKNI